MVYRFVLLSDENDFFRRALQIDSEASFLELNNFIIDSLGYTHDEMTTFHICDEAWQMQQEVTLMDMGLGSEYDTFLMEETPLEALLEEKGQHVFFVFDMLSERGLFMELKELIPGQSLEKPVITLAEGKAPKQSSSVDDAAARSSSASSAAWEEDIFSEEGLDEGDIDLEGFDIADADSLY